MLVHVSAFLPIFNNMDVLKNCMIGQTLVLKRKKEEAKKIAINLYKNDKYWGVYKYIYSLEGEVPSEKQQCESPRILFESNNVVFTSNTPNVKENIIQSALDEGREPSVLEILKSEYR